MPEPVSDESVRRGLRYAQALGIVAGWTVERTTGATAQGNRRRVTIAWPDGSESTWNVGQVLAFTFGVEVTVRYLNAGDERGQA